MHIIFQRDGDQVSGQAHVKLSVTNFLHLRHELVHDGVGLVGRNESVMNRDAIHPEKIVIVQFAVGASPAADDAGGGIVESFEIRGL